MKLTEVFLTEAAKKYVLVVHNPWDRKEIVRIYGPFNRSQDAEQYKERAIPGIFDAEDHNGNEGVGQQYADETEVMELDWPQRVDMKAGG